MQVGDEVVSPYGDGLVLQHSRHTGKVLVGHFEWSEGHNGGWIRHIPKAFMGKCWWFDENVLDIVEYETIAEVSLKTLI